MLVIQTGVSGFVELATVAFEEFADFLDAVGSLGVVVGMRLGLLFEEAGVVGVEIQHLGFIGFLGGVAHLLGFETAV